MRMFIRLSIMSGLVLSLGTAAAAQTPARATPPPAAARKAPVAPNAAQLDALRRGIRLHDEGHYGEAIALYQQILAESPDCVIAIGELANSYLLNEDWQKAIDTARRALAYETPDTASLYVVIGSAFDDMGDTANAIDAYREGIAASPHGLLYYNLALTYLRQRDDDSALSNLKRAALLTPNHASTQYELARLLGRRGYLSQAVMALSRYLVLEPAAQRTGDAYRAWLSVWEGAATMDADGKITVNARPTADAKEGDFARMDVALGVSRAGALAIASDKNAAQVLIDQVKGWLLVLAEQKADTSVFAWRYYAPYFIELQRRGYVDFFVYWVSQATTLPGVEEWLADGNNRERAAEFVKWSQQYTWPGD